MAQVQWPTLDPTTYERMVAVLINTLHPRSTRIDGVSGDGGRDVQLRSNGSLDVYQLKSQTDRIGKSQRQQIKDSLVKAAELRPGSWTLIVPIDPSPPEEEWFEHLKTEYSFPLEWLGKTWLDRQMAERPHIPRYFLFSGADEAIQIMRDLRRDENELAEGIAHVVARVESWVQRLSDLDPFWDFKVSRDAAGQYTISPSPKYVGADRDRPITVTLKSRFPKTDEGRAALTALQDAINFGRRTTVSQEFVEAIHIDAPAGMGGVHHGSLTISSSEQPAFKADLTLAVINAEGRTLASLPLTFKERTAGMKGTELTGIDASGFFSIRMRSESGTMKVDSDFTFEPPAEALPGQVLAPMRLVAAMRPPNQVRWRGKGRDVAHETSLSIPEPIDPNLVVLVEALARIQDATATSFPIPEQINAECAEQIVSVDKLLKGEPIPYQWTEMRARLVVQGDPVLAAAIVSEEANSLRLIKADWREDVCGHEIGVGDVEHELSSAILANHAELEAKLPLQPGIELQAVFVPGANRDGVMRRVTAPTAG